MDLWNQLLDLTSQLVTPIWGALIEYIPLVLLGLIGLVVLAIAWMWVRNAAVNRSRVLRPLPAGPVPAGVHMPGPSIWPFIAPIGLFLIFLSLIFGVEGAPNLALLAAGLVVAGLAAVGWFLDAGQEYRVVETANHRPAVEAGAAAPAALQVPAGVHLPGPSPWPFFAPIGLFFVFLGLIFSPVLLIGGVVLAVIAAVGWWLDAGREWGQVDAGRFPEPTTRDPERAFPKRLVPVYVGVAAVTLALAMGPWLLSFLPGGAAEEASPSAAPVVAATEVTISASTVTSFEQSEVVVKADTPITLTFDNKQAGVPHNVAIYDSPRLTELLWAGTIITGPSVIVETVIPLPAGEYTFICQVHPPMIGKWIVK